MGSVLLSSKNVILLSDVGNRARFLYDRATKQARSWPKSTEEQAPGIGGDKHNAPSEGDHSRMDS